MTTSQWWWRKFKGDKVYAILAIAEIEGDDRETAVFDTVSEVGPEPGTIALLGTGLLGLGLMRRRIRSADR